METVNSKEKLEYYLESRGIDKCFSNCKPRLYLLHYAPGELLTTPFSPSDYLHFVVDGSLLLYNMPDEESVITLQTTHHEVHVLGEMELLDRDFTPFFVDAKTDVYTLSIHLSRYRQELLNDPVFLRYLCNNLAQKLNGAVMVSSLTTLKQRVLRSLHYMKEGDTITDIARLARSINASPRQLLRVLKELCQDGYLEHEKKGVYRVLKKPEK